MPDHDTPIADPGFEPGYRLLRAAYTMGFVLATAISWSAHHSVFWACVDALLSWAYIVKYSVFG